MRRDFIAHRKRTPNTNSSPKTGKRSDDPDAQTSDSNTPSNIKSDDDSQLDETSASQSATSATPNVIRLISAGQSQVIPFSTKKSSSIKDQELGENLNNQDISDYYSETENNIDNDDSQSSEVNRLKRFRTDEEEEFDESFSGANSPSCHSVASVSSNETENTTSSSHSNKKRKQSNPKKYIKTESANVPPDVDTIINQTNTNNETIIDDENDHDQIDE